MTATRILSLSRIHNNGPGGHVPDALPVLIERHDHDPNREVEKTVYEHEQVSNQGAPEPAQLQIRAEDADA